MSGSQDNLATPFRLAVFADGPVGTAIVSALKQRFPDDIALVVVTSGDSVVAREIQDIPTVDWSNAEARADALGAEIDLGLCAWWPHILKAETIRMPRLGFLNTHPSLLPHNRGKNPNFWSIVEERPFGVSVHWIDEDIDSGDIVARREIPVDWTDTGETLYRKACAEMVPAVVDAYAEVRSGTAKRVPQSLNEGSFHRASELDPASRLDLDAPTTARAVLNRLRARTFSGYPACWFEDGGRRYEARIEIVDKDRDQAPTQLERKSDG